MRHMKSIAVIALAGALASACQSSNRGGQIASVAPQGNAVQNRAAALNGQWQPPAGDANAGLYTAEFRNGDFLSRAVENGNVLAKGSYSVNDAGNVSLSFTGAASKQRVEATCISESTTRLSCTPTVGGPFVLVRS